MEKTGHWQRSWTSCANGIVLGRSDSLATCARDLRTIGDWIARDNPPRALSFIDDLRTACAELADFPRAYPADARFGEAARRRTLGNYQIIYDLTDDRVLILTIVHAARDQGPLS